jgi:hypothetical protein
MNLPKYMGQWYRSLISLHIIIAQAVTFNMNLGTWVSDTVLYFGCRKYQSK